MGKKHKLTATAVEKYTKPKRYGDGGGLWFNLKSPTAKCWEYRYRDAGGKNRTMGLGGYPVVSLAEARQKALECARLRERGIDPMQHQKAQQAATRAAEASKRTFAQCIAEFIEAGMVGCTNDKAAKQWPSTLNKFCIDLLPLPVDAIDTPHVLQVLQPIWHTKHATATRLRGRMESVLEFAAGKGYRPKGTNPAQWKGNLKPLLAAPSKIVKENHHRALPYREMAAFMVELRKQDVVAARAAELIILTAMRTGSVLNAKWDEFDLVSRVWTAPFGNMKKRKTFRVPLSDAAITLLESMQARRESDYVFPGARINRPLSNMACLKLLDRMKMRDRCVMHGFRSTFRDWAAEETNYPKEVITLALAHSKRDKVEAAYWRSDLLEKRRPLMEDWARLCEEPWVDAKVLPLRKAA